MFVNPKAARCDSVAIVGKPIPIILNRNRVIMRQDIEFQSRGLKCRGWLYVPNESAVKQLMPAIVMAHGISAVKEMFQLSSYAERFEEAGFVTLVFDYRFLGASDGSPRGQIIPP